MKKKIGLGILAATALFGLASCNGAETPATSTVAPTQTAEATPTPTVEATPTPTEIPEVKTMTYAEFMEAEVGDDVRVQGYISAKQSWWNNAAVVYLTDAIGEGYLIYGCPMTQEEFNTKYTIGTCVNITAQKAAYAGLQEIDGKTVTKIEVVENAASYQAVPVDVTSSVKNEDLVKVQNSLFSATLKVIEYTTTDTNTGVAESKAYGYKGDDPTDDLYLALEDANGNVLNACLEAYLTDKNSDVYKYVLENLHVGDLVKVTGFMYWWNGANPHIVSITPQVDTEYESFMAAEVGDDVTVTGMVYARQTFYNGAVLYVTSSSTGEGYVVYKMNCTQEQYDTDLTVGKVIKVTGSKTAYAGLQEITDASYEVVTTDTEKYTAVAPIDVKNVAYAGAYMGASFKGTYTVVEYTNAGSNTNIAESKAYAYKGDTPTSDLYIRVKDENGMILECCVQGYTNFADFGTTKAAFYDVVKGLAVGDKVNLEGAMYWWNGANPHIQKLTKVTE